MNMVVH